MATATDMAVRAEGCEEFVLVKELSGGALAEVWFVVDRARGVATRERWRGGQLVQVCVTEPLGRSRSRWRQYLKMGYVRADD